MGDIMGSEHPQKLSMRLLYHQHATSVSQKTNHDSNTDNAAMLLRFAACNTKWAHKIAKLANITSITKVVYDAYNYS